MRTSFELRNASVLVRHIPVLNNVSMTYTAEQPLVITGATGTGKTTLLRLLIGEVAATTGDVFVNGTPARMLKRSALRRLRKRIGYVEQHPVFAEYHTVFHSVLAGFAIGGLPYKQATNECLQLLQWAGLSHIRAKSTTELSAGERHLVAIARALAQKPDVLLADEPTSTLDATTARTIIQLLQQVQERVGFIITTHSQDLCDAFPTANRLHVTEHGL
jgi:ABC-type methionine transport system ATPase subunit